MTYTYGNSQWGDLLTGYNGKTFTYDAVGNLLSDGERTYTWKHGRQLESMTKGSSTFSFVYNADGMRIRTDLNGSPYIHYVYDGSTLIQMRLGNHTLDFTYGTNGPVSVTWNGTTYYYVTNIQGDVISIVDANGTAVVNYSYDAWGNVIACSGSLLTSLGTLNPFLYRGYVYDQLTGLYYLQSRYYNSKIGRFINADGLVSTGQGLLGNNMFTYCLNNPVNFVDKQGTTPEAILAWWSGGMGWLCLIDTVLPVGDIIYATGIVVLALTVAVINTASSPNDVTPEITYDTTSAITNPPPPNNEDPNNDDDGDDDYYNDDNNFGGRQKVGKPKGNTPGNNQAQNKQFKDATKGLTPSEQRKVHEHISKKGFGYQEIKKYAKYLKQLRTKP